MRAAVALLFAVLAAGAADALALTVTKSSSVVSDSVNTSNPKALPGAVIDYALLVTNPSGNGLVPVGSVQITDTIPTTLKLRVADYGASGSGPVEFADGSLLGTGLLGSGLNYSYGGLGNVNDGLEFSNGTSWAYVPAPDAGGYDSQVRGIRVTMTGTQAAGAAFRLRYRVQVN